MAVKIRINPLATIDLQEIKNYIAEDSIDAATKTVKDIIDKIETLTDFPELGAIARGATLLPLLHLGGPENIQVQAFY